MGLLSISGIEESVTRTLVKHRESQGPYRSLRSLCQRVPMARRQAERLILAGALDCWEIGRRSLLWELKAAQDPGADPLLPERSAVVPSSVPDFDRRQQAAFEDNMTGAVTSAKHVAELIERQLEALHVTRSDQLRTVERESLRVGGAVISRRRPPTAHGMEFLALDDGRGVIPMTLPASVSKGHRAQLQYPFVVVEGSRQRRGERLTVIGQSVLGLSWEGLKKDAMS